MKTIALSILLVFNFGLVWSQSKSEVIKLIEKSYVLQTIDLGENGFIIKTGNNKSNSKNLDWTVHSYTKDLELKWSVGLEKTQINKGMANYMVADYNGGYVYHLEEKGYNPTMGAGSFQITQISKNGVIKTFEITDLKKILKYRRYAFCNKDGLYFLATENGNIKKTNKKKSMEKFYCIKYSHSDFSKKRINCELPSILDYKKSTFWEFIGNNNQQMFFSRKIRDKKLGFEVEIATIGVDGTFKNKFKKELDVKGSEIIPSSCHGNNYAANTSLYNEDRYHFNVWVEGNKKTYTAINESYGEVTYDYSKETFYAYGLKRNGEYFIDNFNKKGEREWNLNVKMPPTFVEKLSRGVFNKKVYLNIGTGDKLEFTVANKLRYVYKTSILKTGSVEKDFVYDFSKGKMNINSLERINYATSKSNKTESEKYIYKLNHNLDGNFNINSLTFSNGRLLIEDKLNNELKLSLFKD